jgi:AcrR family transcriptional regulator
MKSDPPASSIREKKKRQSREAILLAAQKLFVRQGYRETTVECIAASADVAKGTFFNYFDSKEAVLRESYRQLAVRFDAKLVSISRGSDAEAAIGKFFAWAEKEFRSAGRLMDILAEEVGHDAILQKEDEEVGRQDAATFATPFRNAQTAGTVRAELDAGLLGQITVDIWSASVKRWFHGRKTFSLARDLRKRVALLFDGIRTTRASSKRSPKKKSAVALATLLAGQLLVGPVFAKARWWRGEIELGATKKVIELRGDATVSRLKVRFPAAGAEWIEARDVKSSDKEWRATVSLPDGPATIHAKEAR